MNNGRKRAAKGRAMTRATTTGRVLLLAAVALAAAAGDWHVGLA